MGPIKQQVMDDKFFLWHARAYRKPVFHGGVKSVPLSAHVDTLEFKLPTLSKPGRVSFEVDTQVGEMVAAIHVLAPGTPDSPVLIYHHDASEVPPAQTLRAMFPANSDSKLAIYLIEAPFHDDRKGAGVATSSVEIHLAMQAVAVATTERLLQTQRVADAALRIVAGFGQGGFIANRHHVMFDTATAYIPFMAGAAEAETYLSRPIVDKGVLRDQEILRKLLNFDEAWAERGHRNVFPVLGSADLINPFQAEMRSYGNTPIEVWAASHLAAKKKPERMREKILRTIAEIEDAHKAELDAPLLKRRASGS